MKSNLSSFWLCYRGRDPIFSLEKPHTRSLENKEILKFHSDTFDRKGETLMFAQLKDFGKQHNKPTTSWNDSIDKLFTNRCVHKVSKNRHHNILVKSLPKDRSLACSIALSTPDRGLKLSEAEQKERKGGGLVGRFCVPWLETTRMLDRIRKIWSIVSHAKKTGPLTALKNEERNKARQLKPKREILQKTSLSTLTEWGDVFWGFSFSFLGGGAEFNKYILLSFVCWFETWTTVGTRAANGSCSEGLLKNILCIW